MDDRLVANRENWNERTGIHLESAFYDVEGWLREERGPRPCEIEALGDVSGLRLLHLQCHFGLDTMAWARGVRSRPGSTSRPPRSMPPADRTASGSVGSGPVRVLRRLRRDQGARRRDVRCRLRQPGSALLAAEHRRVGRRGRRARRARRPLLHSRRPSALVGSRRRHLGSRAHLLRSAEPYVEDSDETYTDATRPLVARRSYEWNHGIGETVTALIRHGLVLEWLVEHDWTVWPRFPWLVPNDDGTWTAPASMPRVPLTFSLLASRAG